MEEHDNFEVFESKLRYLPDSLLFIDALDSERDKRMFRVNTLEKAVQIKKLVEELEWAIWDLKDTARRNHEWLETLESAPIDYQLGAAVHTADYKMSLEFLADLVRAVDLEKGLQEADGKGFLKWALSYPDCCPWPKCRDHCPKD